MEDPCPEGPYVTGAASWKEGNTHLCFLPSRYQCFLSPLPCQPVPLIRHHVWSLEADSVIKAACEESGQKLGSG